MREFKVTIVPNPLNNSFQIYLYYCLSDGSIEVFEYGTPKLVKYSANQADMGEIKPSLMFSGYRSSLGEFANAINHIGIKPTQQSEIQGKLEAQTYHLEDLRKLLKLKQ